MKEITVQELKQLQDQQAPFQLVDVRETYEHDIANIGGDLIPMGSIPNNIERIRRDVPVIVYCRTGARSGRIVYYLETKCGFTNVSNLKGGIHAYAREIDSTIARF